MAAVARRGDDGAMEHESITPMTDDEAELFRFIRYGQLPDRVQPGQMVETVRTDAVPDEPPSDDVRRFGY